MKKWKFVLPMLAAILMLTVVAPAGAQKTKGPKLTVNRTSFNIDDVKPGSTVTQDFILKNTGDEEVRILKVISSCGCTVAKYEKTIAPGQSSPVTLKVKVYPDWAGRRFSQSSVLETTDPQAENISLTVNISVAKK